MKKKAMNRPPRIGVSKEAYCAKEVFCYSIECNAVKNKGILASHRMFLGMTNRNSAEERVYLLVTVKIKKLIRLRLMDAITGSLFDIKTGKCFTSDRLFLARAKESKKAAEILRKWSPSEVQGGIW